MSRRCCCPGECAIVTDSFERDDADDPGVNWNEVDLDWDIDTNRLVEAGNLNSRIITTASNSRSGRGVVLTSIDPVEGSKYRLLVNSKADGSVYQYVQAEFSAASVILTAGGETRTYLFGEGGPLGWDITERPMSLNLYLTDGQLYIQVLHTGFGGCVWDNTATVNPDPTRRHAGVMNAGTTSLTIDVFSYSQHHDDNSDCAEIGCYCTYNGTKHYPAWRMCLSFFSDNCGIGCGGCCCFDGGWANLEWNCLEEEWHIIDGLVCTTALPVLYMGVYRPIIVCGSSDRCEWTMDMPFCCDAKGPAEDCVHAGGCLGQGADVLTCNPFAVRWNWPVPLGDLTCPWCGGIPECPGDYYAILTEGIC